MIRQTLLCWLLLLVFLVSGCSFQRTIAWHAVDFNRAVATSETQTLLLNILRARDRLPPYYTSMSQVRGSVSGSLQSALSLPFGGDATNVFGETVTTSVSSRPTFDLNVLDSEEFVRGITTPVPLSLLQFYWDQRWPRDVLLYLMVSSVRIEAKDRRILHEFGNNGSGIDREFAKFVDAAIGEPGSVGEGPYWTLEASDFGPPVKVASLEGLAKAKEQSLGVDAKGKVTSGASVSLVCPRCDAWLAEVLEEGGECRSLSANSASGDGSRESVTYHQADAKPASSQCRAVLITRSPESMIYYLGEIARPHKSDRCIETTWPSKTRKDDDRDCPLQAQRVDGADAKAIVPRWLFDLPEIRVRPVRASQPSVWYDGKLYTLDTREESRARTALALVRQILSLQKKGKDLPTTNTVNVVAP